MAADIDRFVLEENIKKYRNLLQTKLEPTTRATLLDLLADAEQDLKFLNAVPIRTTRHNCIVALYCLATTLAQAA